MSKTNVSKLDLYSSYAEQISEPFEINTKKILNQQLLDNEQCIPDIPISKIKTLSSYYEGYSALLENAFKQNNISLSKQAFYMLTEIHELTYTAANIILNKWDAMDIIDIPKYREKEMIDKKPYEERVSDITSTIIADIKKMISAYDQSPIDILQFAKSNNHASWYQVWLLETYTDYMAEQKERNS